MERRATTNDCENCAEKNICEVQNIMNNYGFQCKMFSPYRPQTNYDRIISKTPEELAEWIELLLCPSNCPDEQMGEACARTSCDGCWLSWLKSPVEEGEGEGEG